MKYIPEMWGWTDPHRSGPTLFQAFLSMSFVPKTDPRTWFFLPHVKQGASQVALVVKNLPGNAGDVRDVDSTPELERSPGGGHSNPLQYSFLENSMDRGAWWATVREVSKSQTWLSDWACTTSMYMNISVCFILTMTLWSSEVNYYFIPILL